MHANAWLISPKFVLPNVTNDSLTFAWWETTNSGFRDSYSVVISTTTSDTAAFTTVLRPYDTASGTWTMRTVDLTAYAGQSVYIAFHHVDYNNNYLLIDDISLFQGAYVPPAPDTLTVTFAVNDATMGTTVPAPGTYQYITGDTVTFHPEANTGYHFTNWVLSAAGQTDTLAPSYVSVYFLANTFMSYGTLTLTALFEADSTGPVVTDPTVVTNAASDIAQTTATLNATITNPDNVAITDKGFEWKATAGGTYTQVSGTGTGSTFTADLTGLTPETSYTYKAYITFNGTTVYGEEMTFTTEPVGINAYELNNVVVYPNPTTGLVQIKNEEWRMENVEVYDAYGKLLNVMSVNDHTATLDLGGYAAGTYFVRITTEKGVVTKRVVKN